MGCTCDYNNLKPTSLKQPCNTCNGNREKFAGLIELDRVNLSQKRYKLIQHSNLQVVLVL